MSGTPLQIPGEPGADEAAPGDDPTRAAKNPFLVELGRRARALRARRGMTRRQLATAAGVSERHLANLEYGVGNPSVLVLQQVAGALQCALAELLGDPTTRSPEWLLLRELLANRDEDSLRRVRLAVAALLDGGTNRDPRAHSPRIALIGLRGAGKSTLGAMLAADLGVPFVELSREIERIAGCSVGEIQDLYGPSAYRRYERRALEEAVRDLRAAVIATPGGLVAEPANFNLLLGQCTTVWLRADPAEHMKRVVAQGDLRPMAASSEAMADLQAILAGREPFYAKADFQLDTSARPLAETAAALRALVRGALGRAD